MSRPRSAERSSGAHGAASAYRRPMSDPTPYTHGYGAAVLGSHRARTAENSAAHLLPHLRPGQRLLDVGSGAGTITADLARIVGPEHVVALEVGEESAALTRAELERQGLGEVDVRVGDAQAMPFEDDAFDVVHAHQVLQHLPAPVQALAEMRRVTRPGGLVAVRDSDYEGFRWWPETPAFDRWLALYLRATRANGGTPDAGQAPARLGPRGRLHATSPRAAPPGCTRPRRAERRGRRAGRAGSPRRRSRTSSSARDGPTRPSARRSPRRSAPGRRTPTAGSACCTARSSPAPDRAAPADRRARAGGALTPRSARSRPAR
jgi:SAM-dependent methyltransferase